MRILELSADHYWGETWCSVCASYVCTTYEPAVERHIEEHHNLVKEDPNNFTFEEDAKIAELFGSHCRRWFDYYRHTETGELWAVRIEND